MAFLVTTNGALVVARFQRDDEIWSNHMWASMVGFDDDDLQDLVNNVKSTFVTHVLDDFSIDTDFLPFRAYDMRSVDGTVLDDETGLVNCTGGTDPLSTNNACVLTLYTAKRGRAHRGRLFLGPFTETHMVDGEWAASITGVIATLAAALKSQMLLAGFTWGVRSAQLDGVPRDPAIITPITTTTVRSARVASQRRRVDRP